MTQIKICGLTRADDVALAEDLGADFVGFIFVRSSPRFIEPSTVPATRSAKRVGVFRDASIEEMRRAAEVARLDIIQLHGSESDDVVQALGLPVIKAVHVTDELPDTSTSASWLLFDTGGGTGRHFDWSLLARYDRSKPFLLAGGITPENVAAAISKARPDAIDLASGVESAPGIKDHHKMKTLFDRVRRA